MNTRFDSKHWVTGFGEVVPVEKLATDHALNILRMFMLKPNRTMAMLVNDVETAPCCSAVWSVTPPSAVKAGSIHNVTSLSTQELRDYALESTLGKALVAELAARGVNTENVLDIYCAEAAALDATN